MNEETKRLVCELCARAGMIMEDASATAVLSGKLDDASLRVLVADVAAELTKATALVSAATTLVGTLPNPTDRTR